MENTTKKIENFGEKIGGSRADIWATRGMLLEDIYELNDAEKEKYITKNNIWPKPDYKTLNEEGMSVEKLAFLKIIYDSLPVNNHERAYEDYFKFISTVRESMEKPLALEDNEFQNYVSKRELFFDVVEALDLGKTGSWGGITWNYGNTYIAKGIYTNKFGKAAQTRNNDIKRMIEKNLFLTSPREIFLKNTAIVQVDEVRVGIRKDNETSKGIWIKSPSGMGTSFYYPDDIQKVEKGDYVILSNKFAFNCFPCKTKEEAEEKLKDLASTISNESGKKSNTATKRKGKWMPKYLNELTRKGPECLRGTEATGEDFLNYFSLRGGEFGNWENQTERQENLNKCFEAFMDFAAALNINNTSVGLGDKLAIAFGARGHGSALAHYEPLRNVINLTKLEGAGSLAHELGHALDFYTRDNPELKKAMNEIINTMKYKEGIYTPKAVNKENIINEHYEGALSWLQSSYQFKSLSEDKQAQAKDILKAAITKSAEKETLNEIMKELGGRKYQRIYGELDPNQHTLKDLNTLIKTETGHVLNTDIKEKIIRWENSCNSKCNVSQEPRKCRVETEYFKESQGFDNEFAKDTFGYWASDEEMFARAFAVYITDNLAKQDIRNDYLCGHAYAGSPIPKGEEKEAIFNKMDAFIDLLKKENYLENGYPEYDIKVVNDICLKTGTDDINKVQSMIYEEENDIKEVENRIENNYDNIALF